MGKNLAESRAQAEFEAQLNRLNQTGPFGSVTFTDPGDGGRQSMTTALSPALQAQLDAMLGSAGSPLDIPSFQAPSFGRGAQTGGQSEFFLGNMLPGGATADAFSRERDNVERAQFDRMMSLLNPEFSRQEEKLHQRLANQGLPQAARAFTAETGRFDDTRNRAVEQAALAAVLSGGQEQSRLLSDLLSTSSIGIGQQQQQRQNLMSEALAEHGLRTDEALMRRQLPMQERMSLFNLQQPGNFVTPPATGVPNLASNSVNSPSQLPGMVQGLGSLGLAGASLFAMSDRRLKTDIKRVGQTDDGLPIYTFRYRSGGPVQMGVMAQDVIKVKPEAVANMGGFLAVDYGSL